MVTQKQIEQGAKLMRKLAKNAHESVSFKEQLIENPVNVIRQFAGNEWNLPKGKSVVVEDQSDDSKIYFNIVAKPSLDDQELTLEELEVISGGTAWVCVTVTAAIIDFGIGVYEGYTGNTVDAIF